MSEVSIFVHVLVGFAVLPLMPVGALIDLEMGQRYAGRALFLAAAILFDLNIFSALVA